MIGAMTRLFTQKGLQAFRYIGEICDAGCHDHTASHHLVSIGQAEYKAFTVLLQQRDFALFQLRNKAALKRETVGAKQFQRHWPSLIGIGSVLRLAVVTQSQQRLWIVQIRRKAF